MPSRSDGRNSCSGGSNSRMHTGWPCMMLNSRVKSSRCIGSRRASTAPRSAALSAKIISRITVRRSSSKNMCSVRQRPMPSASNIRATWASAGVSALARMPMSRTASAQPSRDRNASSSAGSSICAAPASASPAVPSRVIMSPSLEHPARGGLQGPVAGVEPQARGADHAGQAQAAGDHRGVAGHAALLGQHAGRRMHPADVLGRGFAADQDAGLALRRRWPAPRPRRTRCGRRRRPATRRCRG